MSFTEKLKVEIETILDSEGIRSFRRKMQDLSRTLGDMQQPFSEARGIENQIDKASRLESKLEEIGLRKIPSENIMPGLMEMGGDKPSAGPFQDLQTGEATDMADAVQRARDHVQNIEAGKIQNLGGSTEVDEKTSMEKQFENLKHEATSVGNTIEQSLQQIFSQPPSANLIPESFRNFNPSQFETGMSSLRSTLDMSGVDASQLEVYTAQTKELGGTTNIASNSMQRMKRKSLAGLGGLFNRAADSVQNLQMKLLGLQFTMLTVAFLFGGLMGPALGAVGAFQILSNTLKFLFLPTALDLLGPLLDLQNFVMGLDEETRSAIGSFALFATVASVLVGLGAALGKAFLTILSPLLKIGSFAMTAGKGFSSLFGTMKGLKGAGNAVGGVLGKLLKFLGGAGSKASMLSSAFGILKTALKVVGKAFSKLFLPLTIITTALTVIQTVAKRFPGVFNAVVKAVMVPLNFLKKRIFLLLKVFMSVFNGIKNIVTGVTTAILGALTGDFDKAVAGIKEIVFGLGQILIKPFVFMINFFKNTVLPRLLDGLTAIPRFIFKIIGGIGSAIMDALPDFISDRLEGVADFGGSVVDFFTTKPSEFLKDSGISTGKIKAPQIGKDFKPSNNQGNKNKGPQQQTNNVTVNAEVNQSDETPQETGRKLGEGLQQGLQNNVGNLSGGT